MTTALLALGFPLPVAAVLARHQSRLVLRGEALVAAEVQGVTDATDADTLQLHGWRWRLPGTWEWTAPETSDE